MAPARPENSRAPRARSPKLISLHGGHTGEFCRHADNSLEEVIETYEKRGFAWVGITEHMPPLEDRFLYPDEQSAGITAEGLRKRFHQFIRTGRRLQEKFAPRMRIFIGFETETYSGSIDFAQHLVRDYAPDYIVGSVHHVDDINFDFDQAHYRNAVRNAGGIDRLYHRYFDAQYDMITRLRPRVVGHFDLVRLHDPDYRTRLRQPDIEKKIYRNLAAVRDLGLILDLNMRALHKGAAEPYISQPILLKALEMNIPVVPGDDSHGVDTVGSHIEEGIDLLDKMGFNTRWEDILRDRIWVKPKRKTGIGNEK